MPQQLHVFEQGLISLEFVDALIEVLGPFLAPVLKLHAQPSAALAPANSHWW